MTVSIQIVVDDDQKVQIVGAGSSGIHLAEILERWKEQAAEPCPAGRKCTILKQWIAEIENILIRTNE